jgi:predicted alpha/beta-fold hydrolase
MQLKGLLSNAFGTVTCSELIKTADGGQISLDWFDNNNSAYYVDASTRPTILLLPGLTGTSKESYILHMIHLSEELGYRYLGNIVSCFSLNSYKYVNISG